MIDPSRFVTALAAGAVMALAAGAGAAQAATTATYEPRNYFNGEEEFPNEYLPAHVEVKADDAANSITAQKSGDKQVTISDPGGVTAGKGCTQASATSVTCPLPDYVLATLAGGNDTFTGGAGVTLAVDGGAGNDTLAGHGGTVFGEGVETEIGAPALVGGDGNDVLSGTDIALLGDAGDDTLTVSGKRGALLEGGAGRDKLTGGPGGDTLDGGADDDDLDGGDGNDTLDGDGADGDVPLGDDDVDGGAGTDLLDWSNRTSAVDVGLNTPAPDGAQGEKDRLSGIEHVATGSGNDQITGTDAAERIAPGEGQDTVSSAGGDDFLDGGDTTSDTLDLGAGSDTVSYHALARGTVDVNLGDPAPDGPATGKDTLTGVENAIGTLNSDSNGDISGSDRLVGDAGPNVLVGLGGPDRLDGGDGADSLYGEGRPVDYTLEGVDASPAEGAHVDLSYPANDRLRGGPGNDLLDGGIDSDRLDGGAGADRFEGDGFDREPRSAGSVDVVDYSSRTAPVTASVGTGGGEAGEGDVYTRIEGIRGGKGDDRLTGRKKKADRLFGGAGADVLNALTGKDRVSGGSGRDRIRARDGQRDRVDCGKDRDRARVDANDRVRACERR